MSELDQVVPAPACVSTPYSFAAIRHSLVVVLAALITARKARTVCMLHIDITKSSAACNNTLRSTITDGIARFQRNRCFMFAETDSDIKLQ